MKKAISMLSKVILSFLLISSFSNCKNEKKTPLSHLESTPQETAAIDDKPTLAPVVFITGVDGRNQAYYSNARNYFEDQNFKIVDNAYSVEEIIHWLNNHGENERYGEIHIVNKGNPFQGMELETTIQGEKVTENALYKEIVTQKLPKLKNVISTETKVIFHSNGIGENEVLLDQFKRVFTANTAPQIMASKYVSVFDSPFSNHHLAKAYYVFYPTAKSPGKTDLSKEIARKYPSENEIDWFDALNNEYERYVGEAYTTQYNVPVQFELDYTPSDNEVPVLESTTEIINFILQDQSLAATMEALKIPLDKFRWKASISKNKLTINGISTVLCVLKPIIKPFGDLQHQEPSIDNLRLYGTN